ncbi:hypothetical protein IVB69_11790 [Flavobacterium sp. J49]|uniref:hypothetical protein n=1 Tax=Flavobacterium sp. J49 TaxID=2718534 RepID=UPI001592F35D|nr:hypothetical protein [Flavobacterium sp. J49]MBF6642165.1 hypothetical protein [Flavobacterium sp. J49]NIC03412.1 hypothetical protein [Flavobacterium sp. J49]
MNYSIANLTLVADCNSLLAWAAREKADLNYKKITIERVSQKYAETSVGLDAELQGVIAEIAANDTIISVLPEGPTKEEALDKKVRLEYKKFVLENRRENYGTVALLQKESELGRIDQQILEVDAFVAAVEARVLALAA